MKGNAVYGAFYEAVKDDPLRGVMVSTERSVRMNRAIGVFLFLLFVFLPGGCAGPEKDLSLPDPSTPVRVVAVIPFQKISPGDTSDAYARCPLDGKAFKTGITVEDSEGILGNLLCENLSSLPGLRLAPAGEVEEAYIRVCTGFPLERPDEKLGMLGKALNADGIFVGFVYRFRERVGTPYAVEQPASVAFSVHYFDVSLKKMTWNGVFDKTQTSLMENLLDMKTFFSAKGKWMTAEQLAGEGIHRVMTTFPVPGE